MEKFWKELETGDIHFRDNWQFELKSDFYPMADEKDNAYTQEFYIFIPNAFQINEDNYPKEQFYRDQTNLIRFKTPEFTFQQIMNPNKDNSPLVVLKKLKNEPITKTVKNRARYEFKLLANIIRSALREEMAKLTCLVKNENQLKTKVATVCNNLEILRSDFIKLHREYLEHFQDDTVIQKHLMYVDEFLSFTISYFLTGFLEVIRNEDNENFQDINDILVKIIIKEKKHRKKVYHESDAILKDESKNEYILYHRGLLNKFVVDPLLLQVSRFSLEQKYRNLIGSIAAGLAMSFYLIFFIWQEKLVFINSIEFVLITIILYILKDRIKEGLRAIGTIRAFRWLSDRKTMIRSPDGDQVLGKLSETFNFYEEEDVPKDIVKMRNRDFHNDLETFKRPERIIYYKKKLAVHSKIVSKDSRRNALNIIFRFNIKSFLSKLGNPYQSYVSLDQESLGFIRTRLPKVYHLNIIMKNTTLKADKSKEVDWKKFRLIIDKKGIKRVEQIMENMH